MCLSDIALTTAAATSNSIIITIIIMNFNAFVLVTSNIQNYPMKGALSHFLLSSIILVGVG